MSKLSCRRRRRSSGATKTFTGTTLWLRTSPPRPTGGLGISTLGSASEETGSSSIGDMTSASVRPRLLLLKGNLLNPGPHCREFGQRVASSPAAHLPDPTALERRVEIDGPIGNVSWTDRNGIAR